MMEILPYVWLPGIVATWLAAWILAFRNHEMGIALGFVCGVVSGVALELIIILGALGARLVR